MPDGFGDILARFGLPRDFKSNSVFGTGIGNLGVNAAELIAPGAAPRDGGFGRTSQGPGECVTGSFDFSAGFPLFVPDPVQSAPGGFGTPSPPPFLPPGVCQELFNTPPLVEAADTPPFFHDNSLDTLEQAVAFYATDRRALDELEDAAAVLSGAQLHPVALARIKSAIVANRLAHAAPLDGLGDIALGRALTAMAEARADMVTEVP